MGGGGGERASDLERAGVSRAAGTRKKAPASPSQTNKQTLFPQQQPAAPSAPHGSKRVCNPYHSLSPFRATPPQIEGTRVEP